MVIDAGQPRLFRLTGPLSFARLPLERHDDAVLASANNHPAGQDGRHARDGSNVLPDAQDGVAAPVQLPDHDAEILRAADDVTSVARDVDASHTAAVPFVNGHPASGCRRQAEERINRIGRDQDQTLTVRTGRH